MSARKVFLLLKLFRKYFILHRRQPLARGAQHAKRPAEREAEVSLAVRRVRPPRGHVEIIARDAGHAVFSRHYHRGRQRVQIP